MLLHHPSGPKPRRRVAPRCASGWWVPAAEVRVGALGQPALDVLKDPGLVDLVEDLVVHAGVDAEGALGCGGTGEEALAAHGVDDTVVAPLQEKKGNADLARAGDELLAAGERVPVKAAGNAVVHQRIRGVAAGCLR